MNQSNAGRPNDWRVSRSFALTVLSGKRRECCLCVQHKIPLQSQDVEEKAVANRTEKKEQRQKE